MTSNRVATIGIGLAGCGFMGAVHSHAWRNAARTFALGREPSLVALCGRRFEVAKATAPRLGFSTAVASYRELLARDDIEIIDVCTPGDSHAEIVIAALEANKHVICEKPLSNTVAEAEAMADAATKAADRGILSMVGYTYRRVPAIDLARRLVAEGRIGVVRQVRAQYLQDWLVNPEFPLVWRLERTRAGSGALGDLGAHIIDLAEYVTGLRIAGVSALLETFINERPLPSTGPSGEHGHAMGEVTVDDAALFTARFEGGAVGLFEATRFATGRENKILLEVNGSLGSVTFDFDAMHEVQLWERAEGSELNGYRKIPVEDPSPAGLTKWWPPGHDYAFTRELADFVSAISTATLPQPSFADGLHVQRVLNAVQESSAVHSGWIAVPH